MKNTLLIGVLIILVTPTVFSQDVESNKLVQNSHTEFDKQRPKSISDKKWLALKVAAQDIKLLPTPSGIGALQSFFGGSISIDNDRALVGATGFNRQGAVYVLDFIGGNWQQTAVLIADDTAESDSFGVSVSLDGDRALVGANRDDDNGNNSGSVYVFDFIGGSWSQSAKLKANDGMIDDEFGRSLSLHCNRVLIGSHRNDNTNGIDAGAVYVFDLDASSWSQTDKLIASDGAVSDFFGVSVSLFNNTALIGSFKQNGSLYVFDFSNNSWQETTKLQPNNGTPDAGFGLIHDLEDGRALITAAFDDENGDASGAAYIFDLINGNWTQSAKLITSDGAILDNFGRSASLSGDRVLIGSISSAYVFDLDTNVWSETSKLVASDHDPANFISFGNTVAIWADKLLIGASSDDDNDTDSGSVYDFRLTASTWSEQTKLSSEIDSATGDFFGASVSLVGNRALIGAPNDVLENSIITGSAYIFDWTGGHWKLSQKLLPSPSVIVNNFGSSVSLDNNRALIGARGDGINHHGAAYFYKYDGNIWIPEIIFGVGINAAFGTSVSLSGNYALIGAPLDDEKGVNSGAVHLFERDANGWSQLQKIFSDSPQFGDKFGSSISIFGSMAIIGVPFDNENGTDAGAVFVFEGVGSGFISQQAKLMSTLFGAGDRFGTSISLNGNQALIGANGDDDMGMQAGAAYLFGYDPFNDIWSQLHKFKALGDGSAGDLFGTSVSLSADRALISAIFDDDNGTDSGSAYVFKLNGVQQIDKLTANDAASSDFFGISVALFGDRFFIGASLRDDNGSNSGAVYIFDDGLIYRDGFE